jgi:hypothetical protein
MSEEEKAVAVDESWGAAPPELRKVRLEHADRIFKIYRELIQKQVESIAKYLLLINAGGAAAVLAAMAQKMPNDFRWTLAAFVGGVVVVGLAMACSYEISIVSARQNATGFTRHATGELDWNEYLAQLDPKNWKRSERFAQLISTPTYWMSYALFIAGCVLGGRAVCLF